MASNRPGEMQRFGLRPGNVQVGVSMASNRPGEMQLRLFMEYGLRLCVSMASNRPGEMQPEKVRLPRPRVSMASNRPGEMQRLVRFLNCSFYVSMASNRPGEMQPRPPTKVSLSPISSFNGLKSAG